jgi:hypothetical protein
LDARWSASLNEWLNFLSDLNEEDLKRQLRFAPMLDEPAGINLLRDVVLQLSYHSILHRAQICCGYTIRESNRRTLIIFIMCRKGIDLSK